MKRGCSSVSRKSLQMEIVEAECSESTIENNKSDSFGMAQVDLMLNRHAPEVQWQHECRKASGFQRICKTEKGVFEVIETVKFDFAAALYAIIDAAMSHVVCLMLELSEPSPICSISNSWIFVEISCGSA